MSNIIGSTEVDKSIADRVVGFDSKCEAPSDAPDGLNVQCLGQYVNAGDNKGTFGLIFEVTTPVDMVVDRGSGKTGSEGNDANGYKWFQITLADSPGSASSNAYFEMWFVDTDANGPGWEMPVTVVTSKGKYTYTFAKGGSGGGHRRH